MVRDVRFLAVHAARRTRILNCAERPFQKQKQQNDVETVDLCFQRKYFYPALFYRLPMF